MPLTTTTRRPRSTLSRKARRELVEGQVAERLNVLRTLEAQGMGDTIDLNGYRFTTASDRKVWIHELEGDELGRCLGAHTDFEAPNFIALRKR